MSKVPSLLLLGILVLVLGGGATGRNATAEPKPISLAPTRIALIDIAKVFKASEFLSQKRGMLIQDIKESEETAKQLLAELNPMKQALDLLDQDAEERVALKEQVEEATARWESYRQAARKRLLQTESEIYVKAYELISAEVAKYAKQHGIDLVIRYSSEPMKEDNPQKIMEGLGRPIVYQNELDISDAIIEAMKRATEGSETSTEVK
jgi:Skp family chaperone for outer membrane proteins